MKIQKNIKTSLHEALGIPDNLYETSVKLYEKILPKIKGLDSSDLNDDKSFTIGFQDKFRIGDYEFGKVFITFFFLQDKKIEKPEIVSMSVESQSQKSDDLRLKLIKTKTAKLSVRVVLPKKFEFSSVYDFILSAKNEMIESLSHELKHFYDAYKKMYDNPYHRAAYSAVSGKQFGIWPIDRFFHDIYYASVNESLVRPSEVAAAIRNNEISQKDFLNFLKDNDTYINLKRLSEFDYNKFRSEVSENMENVDRLLKHLDFKIKKMSDEEKVDAVLKLVMVNVANWTIAEFKNIITTNFLEEMIGFQGEKERVFERFMRRHQKFQTPEEFFKFYEKMFHFVGNKMIRKIAKLYAITGKK